MLLPTAIDGGTVTLYAVWKAASTSANDNFASATAISGSSGSTTGSNVGSTVESGEPLLSVYPTATTTVWWKWTAPSSGSVRIDTTGSSFDTQMGIFTGSSVSSLTLVTKDDDSGANYTSVCTFNCTGGITYYICVGGYQGRTGTIKLNWNLTSSGVESDFEIVDGVLTKYKGSGGAVTIPSGVTKIGQSAFEYCHDLTAVTIPSSVWRIDDYAFYGCSELTAVTISSGVTSIGQAAFFGCGKLPSVTIPSSVTDIGITAFNCCGSLTRFVVDGANTVYKSANGLLLSKDGKRLVGGINGAVTIPSGVSSIEGYAFRGCTALTTVTIPSGVTAIDIMGTGFLKVVPATETATVL